MISIQIKLAICLNFHPTKLCSTTEFLQFFPSLTMRKQKNCVPAQCLLHTPNKVNLLDSSNWGISSEVVYIIRKVRFNFKNTFFRLTLLWCGVKKQWIALQLQNSRFKSELETVCAVSVQVLPMLTWVSFRFSGFSPPPTNKPGNGLIALRCGCVHMCLQCVLQ